MRILIIGSGGREHALAWKVLQSPRLTQLYLNSPNAGFYTLRQAYPRKLINFLDIKDTDITSIVNSAIENKIDLVVIGSEAPLAAGLSDHLKEKGILAFGPSKAAAQIEASKAFAKDFMKRHHIPTAEYAVLREFSEAVKYIEKINYPIVIKASGLAAGKGVFLPETLEEAKQILERLLVSQALGEQGTEVIIEERLNGEEISLLAFTDGITIKPMPLARDHKRLYEDDRGPNTGGMGAYAPAVLPGGYNIEELVQQVLAPTVQGMREENKLFTGVLYAGLMLTPKGVRVLEFNCRFGDPETQVLLPLLLTDIIDIMQACATGHLLECPIEWKSQTAVCVVLASEGYPDAIENTSNRLITGLLEADQNFSDNTMIFHAGTRFLSNKNTIVTHGGRVLGVSTIADTLQESVDAVYQAINTIHFTGMYYRRDIGQKQMTKIPPPPSASTPFCKGGDCYANAGVNIQAGNQAVTLMTETVRSTYGKEVLAGIGAFGGMYDIDKLKKMHHPVLVASTDGIGTKVHVAAQAKRWESLGYDIVHHSVNDILVQGARPLFFLDYLAAAKLEPKTMAAIVTGMASACRAVGCVLLGGETAEMPGVYLPNMIDVAGTIVGIVEKEATLPRANIKAGDVLLGLSSSGPHTNGYALIRKIFEHISLETVFPELETSLAESLLAPHRCYLPVLQVALTHPGFPIKGLVHITGGGFFENIPRILPEGVSASLRYWPVPALFKLIQSRGEISTQQMYRVFNMGIGMIIITASENVKLLESLIAEPLITIGELVPGNKEIIFQ